MGGLRSVYDGNGNSVASEDEPGRMSWEDPTPAPAAAGVYPRVRRGGVRGAVDVVRGDLVLAGPAGGLRPVRAQPGAHQQRDVQEDAAIRLDGARARRLSRVAIAVDRCGAGDRGLPHPATLPPRVPQPGSGIALGA